MELLYLLSGALLLGAGAALGWYARDRAAVSHGEAAVPLVEPTVGDPVVVPFWGKPDDDDDDSS